jgi:tetratricopeptide (TPR) repeat protein
MAGKKKIIKKKLKEPDEFISFTDHAFRFISRHYRRIIAGAVILGVLMGGFFLFQKWEEKKEGEAYLPFSAALELYQMVDSPYREGSPANYKGLIEKFDEVIKKFPRTSSGKLSLLYKGNLHLRLGEFDEAIKAYEPFLQKAGKEKFYGLLATEGLGYAHEGKKEYEKAIEAYERMLETGEGLQVANAYLSKGRCYERLGKKKEALESYKAFLNLAPKAMMANLVSERISQLED